MSEDIDPHFKCLVLFAALSDRSFTKSDLGLKLSTDEIKKLSRDTGLLSLEPKGRSLRITANERARSWAGEHLHTDLESRSKAAFLVLDLVRAKTAAFLKAHRISFAEFIERGTKDIVLDVTPSTMRDSGAVDAVRRAYLALTNGAYGVRVLLKHLRPDLHFDRSTQDAALKELLRTGEAHLYPEDDAMSRDEADERAALQIADRRRHIIYLRPEPRQ